MILRATQSGHLTASRDPGQVQTRQPLAARRREPILAASGGATAGRSMDFDPSQIRKGLIGAVVLLGAARIAFPPLARSSGERLILDALAVFARACLIVCGFSLLRRRGLYGSCQIS